MFTKIIAFILLFYFLFVPLVLVVLAIRLRFTSLLALLLKYKWPLVLLTLAFTAVFIVGAIGLWRGAEWAVPVLSYAIYGWLVYLWLYNGNELLKLVALLKWEEARSISQFMGRSEFFDQLIYQLIELSKRSGSPGTKEEEPARAATDSDFEAVLNDEELFQEVFPDAVRKKIRRKLIGLLVHTVLFWGILMSIR